jgi:methylenetetrahydrofolate reductase (NADPH)
MSLKYPAGFSIEFFPPKSEKAQNQFSRCIEKLSALDPLYFSITYGAGGSTKEPTKAAVQQIVSSCSVPAAPHLSCIGESKEQLRELIHWYKDIGVNRIVALRGDLPSGMGTERGEFRYAAELVRFIREETGDHFHIAVAAYPEMHPQAVSFPKDFHYFTEKVAAGASSAISQFFFNIDAYSFFLDSCADAGITVPIVPGIMPIYNYQNLVRFADGCGAEVPRWLRLRMESYRDPESMVKFGEEVVTRLCQQLLEFGCPGLHFYALNRADTIKRIWNNLGLSEHNRAMTSSSLSSSSMMTSTSAHEVS